MRKFLNFILIMAVLLLASSASAATVKQSTFFDNTYVGINGGVTGALHGNYAGYENFGKSIKPVFGVRIGKNITPIVGLQFQGEAGLGTWNMPTDFDHSFVALDLTFNVNNMLHSYTGHVDAVEVVPYIGIGWWHTYGYVTNNMATQFGPQINFNLGKARAWQLNLIPSLTYVLTTSGLQENNVVNFDSRRAYASVQVGVTYKFENHYGTHNFVVCDKVYTQSEMDVINEQVNQLRQTNSALADALKACQEKPVPAAQSTVVEKVVLPKVQFTKGSSKISETSKAAIQDIANYIKANPDKKYACLGYASTDGPTEFNMALSKKRAEVLKQALVDAGADASKIETQAMGETEKFGSDPILNRIAIIGE